MEEKAQLLDAPIAMVVGAHALIHAVDYNSGQVSNRSTALNVIITIGFTIAWLCFSICKNSI